MSSHQVGTSPDDHVVVISSDTHAGASMYDYKPYLEKSFHDDFEAWASTYVDPWSFLDPSHNGIDRRGTIEAWQNPVNWDTAQRLPEQEADGVVAEVVFPNTAPPFIPTRLLHSPPPRTRTEYEQRWAGLRAHNRWLVDFCQEAPGRRAGVAQVMLYDVDDAIDEVRWCSKVQLTGGILLPSDLTGDLPLHRPEYEPLWAVCEELGVPVHRHAAAESGELPTGPDDPEMIIGMYERAFFNTRGIPQLIFSGVFERYPDLHFVSTESGCAWVPEMLARMDAMYNGEKTSGGLLKWARPIFAKLPLSPGEYFRRNCFLGASMFTPAEARLSKKIGVDRIMWGQDYPHGEGTYPYSREAFRVAFAGIPAEDIVDMLGRNAARVYGFDLTFLQPLADRVGPTLREISEPLITWPRVPEDTSSPVFNRQWHSLVGE